jgi:OmcA/MtrC family decaheme c-type cytochrome
MVHKIHFGKELPSVQAGTPYQIIGYGGSVHDYSKGGFPQPINNCAKCHTSGSESTNWYAVPSIEACGSCHDDVNFATGTGHQGGVKTNAQCAGCHNSGAITLENPQLAHRWADIVTEAADWAYVINTATYDSGTGQLTVNFQVNKDVLTTPVATDLATDPAWLQGSASRLFLNVGWKGSFQQLEEGGELVEEPKADYTNPGANESAPGSAMDIAIVNNGVFQSANATETGTDVYTAVITLPAEAQAAGTGIVFMDGHPAVNITGIVAPAAIWDRIPVANALDEFAINDTSVNARRVVVANNLSSCTACHDTLSLHGQNRQGDIRVCTTCHNSANTDIARRPASGAVDGKDEEAIDLKYLIHRIHRGREALAGGITVYGFGSSANVFAGEFPPGSQLNNCTTCHATNTYKPPLAMGMEGTTIDSGSVGHADDLNISPTAAVCSGCHDSNVAKGHMTLMGGSFSVLEENTIY